LRGDLAVACEVLADYVDIIEAPIADGQNRRVADAARLEAASGRFNANAALTVEAAITSASGMPSDDRVTTLRSPSSYRVRLRQTIDGWIAADFDRQLLMLWTAPSNHAVFIWIFGQLWLRPPA
jgi:hypothetical protein